MKYTNFAAKLSFVLQLNLQQSKYVTHVHFQGHKALSDLIEVEDKYFSLYF